MASQAHCVVRPEASLFTFPGEQRRDQDAACVAEWEKGRLPNRNRLQMVQF